MYILKVEDNFSAAHKLINYKGECSNIHGHNWKIGISIQCYKTSNIGLTIDFKEIKKIFSEIIKQFDHTYLNDLSYFSEQNPTSENIARTIYHLSAENFDDKNTRVKEISVKESDKYTAIYRPDENN